MKKLTLITLFTSGLILTACGQKGPLILEKAPSEKTQTPLENTNDVVPVEEESTDATAE